MGARSPSRPSGRRRFPQPRSTMGCESPGHSTAAGQASGAIEAAEMCDVSAEVEPPRGAAWVRGHRPTAGCHAAAVVRVRRSGAAACCGATQARASAEVPRGSRRRRGRLGRATRTWAGPATCSPVSVRAGLGLAVRGGEATQCLGGPGVGVVGQLGREGSDRASGDALRGTFFYPLPPLPSADSPTSPNERIPPSSPQEAAARDRARAR
jgi:hypothetical protein